LIERHSARQVVVGKNFKFGRDRVGNLDTLQRLGAELGFEVRATELLSIDGDVVSSSRIRRAVRDADLDLARRLLGRPHRLVGSVTRGDGRGRQLGFPTANLRGVEELLPPHGVYAVRSFADSVSSDGVLNVGVRPTFGPGEVTVEVHLFDFDGDLVDVTLKVDLVARIREERRFPDPNALQEQIARDVELARQLLSSLPRAG
jgi:riboflavin kinase/FMN adenylyltransferase